MPSGHASTEAASRPDPATAGTPAELVGLLRVLKAWSGDPSFHELSRRTGMARSTLAEALSRRRRTLPSYEVVLAIVAACGADTEEQARWRQAWRGLRADRAPEAPPSHRDAPAQLPADVPAFVGRDAELARLDALLAGAGPSSVVISAVSGTAGVGKTALAVRWAHRVADRFPDGQLYVDLRGYDPERPVSAAEALAGFLRALGTDPAAVPFDLDERAAAYRSLLAGRRVLVVLDNAGTVGHVRALLPGAATCLAVVTSRDSLAGLVARDGACRVDLDLLPAADALDLLRALVGDRVDTEPAAAELLVARCARLPLALRIAAELAAARPDTTLAALTGELADERRRLDLLDTGDDPRTAVRSVFSWSYRQVPATAARAFRLLGLHAGPDADAYAVAALADTDLAAAQRDLDTLARAHLVHRTHPGRYGRHDLLRAYGVLLAASETTELDRVAARGRLHDHYLSTAAAAVDVLMPAGGGRRPAVPAIRTPAPDLPDVDRAAGWLDAERATLIAVATQAADDVPTLVTALSGTLVAYLNEGGHRAEAVLLLELGLRAARSVGDRAAEGRTLSNLGIVNWSWGRYDEAVACHNQALRALAAVGDRLGEASALGNLGNVHFGRGRNREARAVYLRALEAFRDLGDEDAAVRALGNLAMPCVHLGSFDEARGYARQALDFYRAAGDAVGQAEALHILGCVDLAQGDPTRARALIDDGVELFHRAGSRAREGRAHASLGEACLGSNDVPSAVEQAGIALDIARDVGDREGEVDALRVLGLVRLREGRPAEASALLTEGLDVAREVGARDEEARLLNDIGDAHLVGSRVTEAAASHRAALSIAVDTGNRPEQARATAGLARAGAPGDGRGHLVRARLLHRELGLPAPALPE